ncbi:MAG: DUF1311 domain-containing protein [Gammaproteobacteria bacterium]|nr:DUF1311 domain-containing protein [Gammaproteobacteria bacterium]
MKLAVLALLSSFSLSSFSSELTQHLRDFDSEELFENHLQKIKTECLGKSMGGSRAVSCFSAYSEAWDKELNYYYNLLKSELTEENQDLLKSAQLSWIKNRDSAIDFNSALLDAKYEDKQGTMYVAMRSGDASRAISPIIRNRALLIKQWYVSVVSAK